MSRKWTQRLFAALVTLSTGSLMQYGGCGADPSLGDDCTGPDGFN